MSDKTVSFFPKIAEEIDILTNKLNIRHYAYAHVLLNGEQEAGWPGEVEMCVYSKLPSSKNFKYIEFVPAYANEDLALVGYVENSQFGVNIDGQLLMESNLEHPDKKEELAYAEEMAMWSEAMRRNAQAEQNEMVYLGDITPKLKDLQGFGYIMREMRECKDGEIEGPASIATWSWLADFASPQNDCVDFHGTASVGIPWVTFAVVPPEEMTDPDEQEKFLADNAARRAEVFDVEYLGKLEHPDDYL